MRKGGHVTSQFEDTPVDQIDFESLSDEQLEDVAKNDSRSTAQEAAGVEQRKREAADESQDSGEAEAPSEPPSLLPSDPLDRAKALGLNVEGINVDPDAGQKQLQEYADAVDVSGVIPPSGAPPSDALTVKGAVEAADQAKKAREAAQAEAWGK
jgi:hypothetical protein